MREMNFDYYYGEQSESFQMCIRDSIRAKPPAVAAHRMDGRLVRPALAQQLGRLDAVLLRPLFKINIMQQTGYAPKIRVLAPLLREIPHNGLDRQRVAQMERFPVISTQKLPCLLSFHCLTSFPRFSVFVFRPAARYCSHDGFSLIRTPAAMPSAAYMVTIDVPP